MLLIFRYFKGGYLTPYNARKDAGHQNPISSISNWILPAGTSISIISPTALPIKPLAMGDPEDIFPVFRSASFSVTRVYSRSLPVFRFLTFTLLRIITLDELSRFWSTIRA